MRRAIILGGGVVGSAMAFDLSRDFQVTVADVHAGRLAELERRFRVWTLEADLSSPAAIRDAVAPFDVVLACLPSALGYDSVRAVIEAGKPVCDTSFMPALPLDLDGLARERGVTAIVDCGFAPGVSNMAGGWAVAHLERCDRLAIHVGGLPVTPTWPWRYKAPFAPSDVIEEYTRPVRMVEGGEVVTREALTDVETLTFDGLGPLEACNTDGLRSLTETLSIPDMVEKTLRYPGHIELMRVLRATGLFSREPVTLRDGRSVRPLDLTSTLLFPMWAFDDGEEDVAVMRIVAEGVADGARVRHTWSLLDHHDRASGLSAMARNTGFPATIMARAILDGRFTEPGVHPPEIPAQREGLFEHVLAELGARGVRYAHAVERLGAR